MNRPARPAADTAVAFLEKLRPGGPWAVARIDPETGRTVGELLRSAEDAHAWVSKNDGRENLFYRAQRIDTPTGGAGTAKREDVALIEFACWVDIDIDKLGPPDRWDDLKTDAIEALHAWQRPGPLTVIVDTGGGVQALWRLDEPIEPTPDNIEFVEGANRWMAGQFEGADASTWPVAHLLRLPGTMNMPNATKRERGRTPVRSALIEFNDNVYGEFDFQAAPRSTPKADMEVNIGAPEFTEGDEALDALVAKHAIPPKTVDIIHDGESPVGKQGDTSKSGWMFAGVRSLVRSGVPDEVVLGLLLDERWDISAHILSARQSDEDREAYAKRQIVEAHRFVAGEAQEREKQMEKDFDDDPNIGAEQGRVNPMSAWPRKLEYVPGVRANALNGRNFYRKRPRRIASSDGVLFELRPSGVWREVTAAELRAEIRATDPIDTLDVANVRAMVQAVHDLTFTEARPFEWIDEPADAPSPKDLVLFRNGLLNLKSGELMPLDGAYFATGVPDVDHDPLADCPNWRQWLDERLDESFHATLQEWFGYVMVPDTTAHRFVTFAGPPRSGKSTAKNVLENLVGSEHIARKQLSDLGHQFGLQDAIDKRLIVIPDARDAPASSRGQALERLLAITGGDTTGIQRKYLPQVDVKLLTRLLVLGNQQPTWIDESGALAARQMAIEFDRPFEGKEDQTVEDRLMTELSGIANWAIAGLRRLRRNDYKFTIGERGRAAVLEVRRSASPALRFAEDCLEITGDQNDIELQDDIYDAYENWCYREGLKGYERRNKSKLMGDLVTSLHTVRATQSRKLKAPRNWKGGEYRPRVLTGVRLVHKPPMPDYDE